MLRRNVLIFHSGALGDFILTWPLGLALSRLWPQSRIIYVTQKQKGLLAEKVLRLEWADSENGWHHLFGDIERLPEDCRKKLDGAHAVFAFGAKERWVETVEGGTTVSAKPPVDWKGHASEYLLESLAGAPVVAAAVRNMLSVIAGRGIPVGGHLNGDVVIHPGSGSREKCWPAENFIGLAEKLGRAGRHVSFLVGEVEQERWGSEILSRFESAAPVMQPATYRDLLDVVAGAQLFIGNDSGPGHLAGIIGVPSLILFGPSDPSVWKPLGPRVAVLRRQPIGELAVETVYEKTIVSAAARL
jgi:heptosyltransferase III